MKPNRVLLVLGLALAPAVAPAMARAAPICVVNGDAGGHYFTVAAGPSERIGRALAPGETLCLVARGPTGVVSVFVDDNALEGCSRPVAAGSTETLYRYSEFDRCAWSSNSSAPAR